MLELRPYQAEALKAALASLRARRYPVLQLATGTGKSLIIAAVAGLIAQRKGRVWVLTHSQKLVEQNSATYDRYNPALLSGVTCAGLARADYGAQVMFGTIQSVIGPALKGLLPAPDLIIVDEAHRIAHRADDAGQCQKLFQHHPGALRLAMTATPWRMDNGLIYGADPEHFWFNDLAYVYTAPAAVRDGWLCPLVGVETEFQLDVEQVSRGEDFSMVETGEQQTNEWLYKAALSLGTLAARRRHIAVYCPTVSAAMRAAAMITRATGFTAGVLSSQMSADARADALERFLNGEFRVLCSVDMITTGFDFPALDCIACFRPTLSSSLWVQIQGRGTRLHADKKNCLLLDYVGNLQRLGGVDMLETYVREKGGTASEPIEARPAPARGPRRVLPGVRSLPALDPMTGEQARDGAELRLKVHSVSVVALPTRRDPTQPVLLVQYACTTDNNARIDASAFISTERPNPEAREFFARRALAVNLPAPARGLTWQVKGAAQPEYITARKAGRYWNVVTEHF